MVTKLPVALLNIIINGAKERECVISGKARLLQKPRRTPRQLTQYNLYLVAPKSI